MFLFNLLVLNKLFQNRHQYIYIYDLSIIPLTICNFQ